MKKVSLAVVFIMCLFALDFPLTTIHIRLGRAQRGWGEKNFSLNNLIVLLFLFLPTFHRLGFFLVGGGREKGKRHKKSLRNDFFCAARHLQISIRHSFFFYSLSRLCFHVLRFRLCLARPRHLTQITEYF